MPVIDLKNNLPGMGSLITYRNETGIPLARFTEAVLVGESELSRAERELITAYVSSQNDCYYCFHSHGRVAARLLNIPFEDLLQMFKRPEVADEKKQVLMEIAEAVRVNNKNASFQLLEKAKSAGLSEQAFHDAVLTASLTCLFNRYIDILQPLVPLDDSFYEMIAQRLIEKGYAGTGQRQ